MWVAIAIMILVAILYSSSRKEFGSSEVQKLGSAEKIRENDKNSIAICLLPQEESLFERHRLLNNRAFLQN
jgi:hypothetical protein